MHPKKAPMIHSCQKSSRPFAREQATVVPTSKLARRRRPRSPSAQSEAVDTEALRRGDLGDFTALPLLIFIPSLWSTARSGTGGKQPPPTSAERRLAQASPRRYASANLSVTRSEERRLERRRRKNAR
ncbi:hypothetical protein MTO96_029166 [Rhipicephalus appendiculatus]